MKDLSPLGDYILCILDKIHDKLCEDHFRQVSSTVCGIMSSRREGIALNEEFYQKLQRIVTALQNAGYDPYAQLVGFVRTDDDRYITRTDHARVLIHELDRDMLEAYLEEIGI